METKDYVVKRKDIYLGEVVKATGIYKRIVSGNEPSGFLDVRKSVICRNMLFTPTEDKFASDLLYNTEDYPILNGTAQNYLLNLDNGSIVVRYYYNLEELLDYFCYSEELDINDVIKLYKTFFTGLFSKQNPGLFGKKAVPAEEIMFYNDNIKIVDSKQLEKYQKEYKKLQNKGNGLYIETEESVLPRYYWNLLTNSKESFKPTKEEGKIKKLVRF